MDRRLKAFLCRAGNSQGNVDSNKLPIWVVSIENLHAVRHLCERVVTEFKEFIIVTPLWENVSETITENLRSALNVKELSDDEFKAYTEGHNMGGNMNSFVNEPMAFTNRREHIPNLMQKENYSTLEVKNSHPFQKFMGKTLHGNKRRK